jgi:F-type H+-transporting ATPase subunit a
VKVPLSDSFSLHVLMLLIGAGLLLWAFLRLYRKDAVIPQGWTNALEVFVLFIRNEICIPTMGDNDGRKLTPFFCSLFFFILTLNLMGLIPLFATATGNINVTAALAVVIFALMVGGCIARNGVVGFLHTLAPPGIPWPILIILAPIELAGLFIKPFALAVRLFANMLAGHIVLFAMLGLILLFGAAVAVPAIALALAIYLLEALVAFLQAYIFVFLSAMFVGMMLHPEH